MGSQPNAGWWYSDSLDLTGTPTGVLVPAKPGFLFGYSIVRIHTISKAGSISTAFTFNAGNDASKINVAASQTPATTIFSSVNAPSFATLTQATIPIVVVDMGTSINYAVTAGATGSGGFAWQGRIEVLGGFVPNS